MSPREEQLARKRQEEAAGLLEQLAPLTTELGERGYLEGLAAGFRDGSRPSPEPAYLERLRSALEEAQRAERQAAELAELAGSRARARGGGAEQRAAREYGRLARGLTESEAAAEEERQRLAAELEEALAGFAWARLGSRRLAWELAGRVLAGRSSSESGGGP